MFGVFSNILVYHDWKKCLNCIKCNLTTDMCIHCRVDRAVKLVHDLKAISPYADVVVVRQVVLRGNKRTFNLPLDVRLLENLCITLGTYGIKVTKDKASLPRVTIKGTSEKFELSPVVSSYD